ncbi:MAG: DNA repair protein RecN [Burkholderiales bacterium]|nr:DNA repair protein RecN [Burkholderiales bacterium]
MLQRLTIRDFVIVEHLELEFAGGFTVLTGETGAGKSILIDALALTLGERADAIAVRQGAARADITAEFDIGGILALQSWLADSDLAGDEGVCLLRRVVESSGRTRGFINGHAATAAQLREAADHLIDIHGQHQHQSLSRASTQRALLDAYGGLEAQAAAVAETWRDWQRRREERLAFEGNAAAISAERERLEWQLQDLDALKLAPGEWAAVGAEHGRLANAASLIEAAQTGVETLSEGEGAALEQVDVVIARLQPLLAHDPRLKDILDALEPARIQLQEAASSLRRYGERADLDPQRLREVERRLEALHDAARKYRVEPEALPQLAEHTRVRLAELGAGGDPETLRRRESEAEAACREAAKKLTAGRRKAAAKLGEAVTAGMQELAMKGGVFEVALEPLDVPAAHGLELVEFRVAPHASMTPQPVSRTASGGELSRLSLAIQTVLSRVAKVPTLIFDEVDVGIGGGVAEIVGRMLRELGERHQVMCITHLPQVAAGADHQWQVSKVGRGGKPSSTVIALDEAARVEEIARMLGGVKITATTRQHAAEMLQQSGRGTAAQSRKKKGEGGKKR